MNIQRTIVALATTGSLVVPALAAVPPGGSSNDDHAQRGLVRPISSGSGAAPVSATPPEAAQPAAPVPASSAPSQPAGAAGGPQHVSSPRAASEQERHTLGGSASPAPSAVVSRRLPSGVDTARAAAAAKAQQPAAAHSASVSSHRFGTDGPASGSVIIPAATPAAPAADHTRRNLVRTIGSSGDGSGSGGRLLWASARHGGGTAGNTTSGRSSAHVDSFNPGAQWSSGFPTTANTFGPCGNNPWSYSNFLYGGPGWTVSGASDLTPEPFTYEPYLGADVRPFEVSESPGPVFITNPPLAMSGFSVGLGVTGPPGLAGGAASSGFPPAGGRAAQAQPSPAQAASAVALSRPALRVNTSYDVRPDFAVAVDAALNGEFSSSIYAMRRGAGINPVGMIGARSSVGSQIASDADSAQRAGRALAIYQSVSRSVVSEADAQFMIGALAAALGDTNGADAAVRNALAAGDASGSAALLHRELAFAIAERIGGWVTGTPVGN